MPAASAGCLVMDEVPGLGRPGDREDGTALFDIVLQVLLQLQLRPRVVGEHGQLARYEHLSESTRLRHGPEATAQVSSAPCIARGEARCKEPR